MKVALDTSVIIELLAGQGDRHEVTWNCYQRHRQAGDEIVVADHALIESFAVLTRAPKPIAMPPKLAEQILGAHFRNSPRAAMGNSWNVIRHTLERGYWGGRVYDSAIAMASAQAGAEVLLTWNLGHFLTIAPEGLVVRFPS